MKIIELSRHEIKDSTGKVIGHSVESIDIGILKEMFELACREQSVDPDEATRDQKISVLKSMGYEKYLDLLKKEKIWSWL